MNTQTITIQRSISCNTSRFLLFVLLFSIPIFGQTPEKVTTIHVATPEWEDYTEKDGTGVYFDVLRAVYEPVGITLTYEIVPWKRAKEMVERNSADALLGEFYNKDLFMSRYPIDFDETSVIFKKSKIGAWNGIQTLAGKTFVWLRGYDYHVEPEIAGIQIKWHEVDSTEQALKMLEKDRVDGYLDTTNEIEFYRDKLQLDAALYQIEPLWTRDLYIQFARTKNAERLLAIYDQRIPQLLADGTLKKFFEQRGLAFPAFTPREQ